MELWLKVEPDNQSIDNNAGLVAKGYDQTGDTKLPPYHLLMYNNVAKNLDWDFAASLDDRKRPLSPDGVIIADGLWHHVAAVYDASAATVQIYLDGVVGEPVTGVAPADYGTNPRPLVLGNHYNRQLDASMDEVALYDYALDATKIAAHISAAAPSFADISVTPTPVNFGFSRPADPAKTETLTITNSGATGTVLNVTDLTMTGEGANAFTITKMVKNGTEILLAPISEMTIPLVAGTDTFEVEVSFDPLAVADGEYAATLDIESNAVSGDVTKVPITAAVSKYYFIVCYLASRDNPELYADFVRETFGASGFVYVETTERFVGDFDPGEAEYLEAADMVFLLPGCQTTDHGGSDLRRSQWEAVTTPIILHSPKLAEGDRFNWLPESNNEANQAWTHLPVTLPMDPIFTGVTLTDLGAGPVVETYIDGMGKMQMYGGSDPGNGKIVSMVRTTTDAEYIMIIRWEGNEPLFHDASPYRPMGPRIMWAHPATNEDAPDGFFGGATDNGKLMLANAMRSLARPAISATPDPVTLSGLTKGGPLVQREISIRNNGFPETIMPIISIDVSRLANFSLVSATLNGASLAAPYGATLNQAAGDEIVLTVSFDPAAEGTFGGEIEVISGDVNVPNQIIVLDAVVSNYHVIVCRDADEDSSAYEAFIQQVLGGGAEFVYVEATTRFGGEHTPEQTAELEAADMIFLLTGLGTGPYGDNAVKRAQWNNLSTPLLLFNRELAGKNESRLRWVEGGGTIGDMRTMLDVSDPSDPIFVGVTTIDEGGKQMVQVYNEGVDFVRPYGPNISSLGRQVSLLTTTTEGVTDETEWQIITRWTGEEEEYYVGSGYKPGGPRIYWVQPHDQPVDFFDFATADGLKMFENAILSMAQPNMFTDPVSPDMGTVARGGAAVTSVITVRNTGFSKSTMEIVSVDIAALGPFTLDSVLFNGEAVASPYAASLVEGTSDTLTITISFDPASAGHYTGSLGIISGNPLVANKVISLAVAVPYEGTVGSRFDPMSIPSLGPLNAMTGEVLFDTDALTVTANGSTMNGVLAPSESGLSMIAVFCFDSINFGAGLTSVTVVGDRPIAMLSQSTVIVAKPISISGYSGRLLGRAVGGTPAMGRAGGYQGGVARTQTTDELNGPGRGQRGGTTDNNRGGGGGASYGGRGGKGAEPSGNEGGDSGPTYGTRAIDELYGGSGGGPGNRDVDTWSNNVGGGAGGGAIEIAAAASITIQPGVVISASGGHTIVTFPEGDENYPGAGGGGGSGGSILLSAPTITNNGILEAQGGSAGAGHRSGGGGGGGRVALYFQDTLTAGSIDVIGGTGGYSNIVDEPSRRGVAGQVGTIFYGGPTAPPARLYVKVGATGDKTGVDWDSAFDKIGEALVAAAGYGAKDIWVAAGTYGESISPYSNVAVYGGFAGTEIKLDERDSATNATIINATGLSHAVFMSGVEKVTLDGFTIQNGAATGAAPGNAGGGIYCRNVNASVVISNCLIQNNTAAEYGAGLYCEYGSPVIRDCVFKSNTAQMHGGAVALVESSSVIANCVFSGNSGAAGLGGAIVCITARPSIANCTFASNLAGLAGGGVACFNNSDPKITNSIFSANTKHAVYEFDALSDPIVSFCLFNGNTDGDYYDAGDIEGEGFTYTGAVPINDNVAEASNNVQGDPKFASATDFRLLAGSAAIDAGTAVGAPARDIIGTYRSIDIPGAGENGTGTETDIGAYETRIALDIVVSPGSINFMPRAINLGSGPSMAVEVFNNGFSELVFSKTGVAIGGVDPDSFITSGTVEISPLASGEGRTFLVAFDPQAEGSTSATLTITTNATASPSIDIVLNGYGLPAVEGPPTSLNLADEDDSGVSNTDNLTNRTTGLTISGMTFDAETVTLWEGSIELASGTATEFESGIDIDLGQGVHAITATSTNADQEVTLPSALLTITIDVTAPMVMAVTPATAGPTLAAPAVDFGVTFDEAVVGFDASADVVPVATNDVAFTGVAIAPNATDDYTVTVSGLSGDGTLTLAVSDAACTDAAGNPVAASAASSVVLIGSGVTLYELTATVVGGGAIISDPAGNMHVEDSVVALTAQPVAGYDFTGWSGDIGQENSMATSISITMDMAKSVTATFMTQTFALTATANGGVITLTPDQVTYDYGTTVTVSVAANVNYTFLNWTGDVPVGSGSLTKFVITMDADKTIEALFKADGFALTTTATSGTVTVAPEQALYMLGTTVTLTAAPVEGHKFIEWTGDAVGTSTTVVITMDANKSVEAVFALLEEYILTLTATAGGTVAAVPEQDTYTEGTDVTVTATPATGYDFVGWIGDASGTTNPLVLTMDANRTLEATFVIRTYTLTVAATNGSVSVNPSMMSWDHGTTVELTATADAHYSFTGWVGADVPAESEMDSPLVLTMDADKSVEAMFTIDTYALTITVQDGGVVAAMPVQAAYDHGSTVTVTATPEAGWLFMGWTGDVESMDNPLLLTMTADISVQATFRELPAMGDFKVTYKNCAVPIPAVVDGVANLSVTNGSGKASIKIQSLKKDPKNWNPVDGKFFYLQGLRVISTLDIAGSFGKLSTDAEVWDLTSTGAIKGISTKVANIAWIEALSVGGIKNTALADTSAGKVATCSVMLTGSGKAAKLSFSGIIVENLSSSQEIKSLTVATKAFKNASKAKLYSLGGIGAAARVIAQAQGLANIPVANDSVINAGIIASISAKGAPVTPGSIIAGLSKIMVQGGAFKTSTIVTVAADLVVRSIISTTPMKSITAKAKRVSGVPVGGNIGVLSDPLLMNIQASGEIRTITGQDISATIKVGDTGTGTIKKITAKGSLAGSADVSDDIKIKAGTDLGFVVDSQ